MPATWIGPAIQTMRAEAPEVGEGKLEADREQQQDDAELGQALDDAHVAHEAEAVRAEHRARPRGNRSGAAGGGDGGRRRSRGPRGRSGPAGRGTPGACIPGIMRPIPRCLVASLGALMSR